MSLRIFTRRRAAQRVAALRREWGRPKDQPRPLDAIAALHEQRCVDGTIGLEAQTAEDLGLTDVFRMLDRTESALGQQALYHRLHRGDVPAEERQSFEDLVTVVANADCREPLQVALGRLRHRAAYDVWRLADGFALPDTKWYWVFPGLASLTLLAVVSVPVGPPAVFGVGLSLILSLVLRASLASWLLVVAGPFRQISVVARVAKDVASIIPPGTHAVVDGLAEDLRRLRWLALVARLSRRDSGGTGDLAGLAMEYVNLALYLDGNALLFGRRALSRHRDALSRVVTIIGDVDAAIAVASWRAEHTGWSRPDFHAGALVLDGVWHPLLSAPVENDATLEPGTGLIVTGSNMAGKTTYLRSLGVAVVMAQTVNTCPARRHHGPPMRVQTLIGRSDSLASGHSYYWAEAAAAVRAVALADSGRACLFLFDELFRGTNRIERVAAAEAVLRHVVEHRPHVAVVTAHDTELVEALAGCYRSVHFDGRFVGGVLVFDFRLREGVASSGNAITLLETLGAPPSIVASARARAEAQLRSGGANPAGQPHVSLP